MNTESYTVHPIGVIGSPFKQLADVPKRASTEVEATLSLQPEYLEGIADIAAGDEIMVVFYFHKAPELPMTVHSHFHDKPMGIFSTRAPGRPNHIGVSVVKVLSVAGSVITFTGVDMLDGTPVLDIKPYY